MVVVRSSDGNEPNADVSRESPAEARFYSRQARSRDVVERTLLVLLVVLVAGCGSLVGGGDPTPTVTPAPVPEPTTTASSPLPPGVTGERVADIDALAEAHLAVLTADSFTVSTRVVRGNQTGERVLRVESPRRYYYRDAMILTTGTRTEFVDDTNRYRRTTRGGLYFSRQEAGNVTELYGWALRLPVRSYLPTGNATVAATRVDGRRHYEIRLDRETHPRLDNLRNYTARAVVRSDGLVRSLEVTYVRSSGGQRVNVTHVTTFSGIGTTTVDPPDWVVRRWNVPTTDGTRLNGTSAR